MGNEKRGVTFSEGERRFWTFVLDEGGLPLPLKIRLIRMEAQVSKPGRWFIKMHERFIKSIVHNKAVYIRFSARGDELWVQKKGGAFIPVVDEDAINHLNSLVQE